MSGFISQEALKFFGIKNTYFISNGGITALCQPLMMKKKSWVCTCSSDVSENGVLRITFADASRAELDIPVRTERTDSGEFISLTNCHDMIFDSPLPDFLTDKIRQYRKLMLGSARRKEQRFPVGQENWKKFALKNPNCNLGSAHGISVPCVIINASVHGALVVGLRSLSFHVNDRLVLTADFTDNRVFQNATLVNTESIQDKYWRYSLHFIEPVSLAWLTHLNELAMQLEDK